MSRALHLPPRSQSPLRRPRHRTTCREVSSAARHAATVSIRPKSSYKSERGSMRSTSSDAMPVRDQAAVVARADGYQGAAETRRTLPENRAGSSGNLTLRDVGLGTIGLG